MGERTSNPFERTRVVTNPGGATAEDAPAGSRRVRVRDHPGEEVTMVRIIAFALFVAIVPFTVGTFVPSDSAAQEAPVRETIDINSATLKQLAALPGVGPS